MAPSPTNNPDEILKFIRDNDINWVDVQFTDVPGTEQHLSVPASAFDESAMENGSRV